MGEFLKKIREQLAEFFEKTEKKKKIQLGVVAAVIVVAVTVSIIMLTRVEYTILYKNLSLKDVSSVTEELTNLGIQWKYLDNDSTTVMIPTDTVNKARVQLAALGLPKEDYDMSGVFDNSGWAETDFVTKTKLLIEKQNQLQKIIEDIEGIEKSSVNVDIPEDTSFLNKEVGTAAVYVSLEGTSALKQETVTAIRNLVAGTFNNLEPENVSLSDNSGRYYDEANASFDTMDQMTIQKNVQLQLNRSLKSFLENLYGQGNVDVLTNVKINFDSKTVDSKVFAPPIEGSSEGLVRSIDDTQERVSSNTQGDVVGATPNTTDTTDYMTGDGATADQAKARKIINYELNEINTKIIENAGQVQDITIAVIINENALVDGAISDDQKKDLTELVGNTAGVSKDKVKISTGKFAVAETTDAQEVPTIPVWLYAVIGVLILGIIALIVIMARRKKQVEEEPTIADMFAEAMGETSDIEEIDYEGEKSEYKVQINNFIDKRPEAVAALMRTWMNED